VGVWGLHPQQGSAGATVTPPQTK